LPFGFYPLGPGMVHPMITQTFPGSAVVAALVMGLVALMLIDGYSAFHYTSTKQ